jgi:hypothetical protein
MANIEEMKQEAADAKMREKAGKAYDKSMTSTESAPVVKKAKGGSIGSASKRADGIAMRGKTKGTMVMCSGGMAKRK